MRYRLRSQLATNPAGARFSAEAVTWALKDAQLPLASFLLAPPGLNCP